MRHFPLSAQTAMALVLSAVPALAVTPEEVWVNWKAAAAGMGEQISARSETRNGNALEITDVRATLPVADSGIVVTTTIDRLTMTDKGDGTVAIALPDSYALGIAPFGAIASPAGAEFAISQPGATVVASGSAGAVSYAYSFPVLTVKLAKATGPDGKPVDAAFEAGVSAFSGTYLFAPRAEGGNMLDASLSIGKAEVNASARKPEDGVDFRLSATIGESTGASKGVILSPAEMEDFPAALARGFAFDSKSQMGALKISVEAVDGGEKVSFSGELGGMSGAVALDRRHLSYGFDATGGKFAVTAPAQGIPPVDGSFGEFALRLAGPLDKSDSPQDFSVLAKLVDVAVSESVWAMAGPVGQLPHDPVSAVLDLTGRMAWKVDILDPALHGGMVEMPQMPVALESANLVQLLLRAAGAEASAAGAMTFDNGDLTSWQGFPAPTGKVTAQVRGLNTLLDRLVKAGLVSADDLSSIRMMLMMFARAGSGPDELTSEVEFRGKSLFVNGQQLQ